ncbi:hypothetical protein G6553_18870 [Nocardioides sp. IC4_145]|uniref:hypothetical protein n=1 Tax=Nocardioides sp. IC4_145 TaxID=2714037 RepID=UPI00140E7679|nr:hypothetical protein [Nocardioides sp. IC4_145]NHC25231.1 hypothetical protein [Nocardioides sp. IC4_145]
MTLSPATPATPTTPPPALGRRALLGATGLGGLAVLAAGPDLAAAAPARSRVSPFDLDFEVVDRQRRVDLLADRFVTLRDSFAAAGRAKEYAVLAPRGTAGAVRSGGGELRIGGGAGAHSTLLRSRTRQEAPYAAVLVDVASFSGDGTRDRVLAGLARGARDHLLAWYDRATGTVGIDLTLDGTTETLGTAEADLAAPFELGFALTSTTVVAFADTGSGPDPLVKATLDERLDLREPAALRTWHNSFGAESGSGTVVLDRVRAGYFGQLGLRDPHLVTHADGTPYIDRGKAYLTFTQAGLGFFETAHWGVWTLDLETYRLEQVANLFFQRDGNDVVLGDHAGHLVRDDANRRWIVTTSTWGDFANDSVEIDYATPRSSVDVLSGVHVLRTRQLRLPTGDLPSAAVGQWDPHVVRIGARWYVGFVNARRFFDFYPALARSPRGGDFTELSLVGADPSKVETEGTVLQRFGGRWYVLASNGDASPAEIRGQYPVYDLEMEQLGVLDAPHPTNIPWPMVIPVAERGRTRWLLVTFNGTQYDEPLLGYGTHGDVVVMEAQRTKGVEFPGRRARP